MTTKLLIDSVSKLYGAQYAVRDFSLSVAEGEFVSLLGPSGSGKSTVLSMIAGLNRPSAGRILIDGTDVTNLPANRRNIGLVFQNYALFPHQTVARNVAFPLKVRNLPEAEIGERVAEALRKVRLEPFAERYPDELSGGQQQRAALARAIVFEPDLLLLDEPLGALDRRLRESLRHELRSLQRQIGITTIMVTHDQEEALSMSDTIVVMSGGRSEQCAPPEELYMRPQSRFVAEFIGSANVVPGDALAPGDPAALFAIRPEAVRFHSAPPSEGALTGTVNATEYCGNYYRLYLSVDKVGEMTSHLQLAHPPSLGSQGYVSWSQADMHPLRYPA